MSKTFMDSPALQAQSEHYPASWRGRVPKTIMMCDTVKSDFPLFIGNREPRMVAEAGLAYDCWVNSHGAVAAILEDGRQLGVKPYEFEVIEWHETR